MAVGAVTPQPRTLGVTRVARLAHAAQTSFTTWKSRCKPSRGMRNLASPSQPNLTSKHTEFEIRHESNQGTLMQLTRFAKFLSHICTFFTLLWRLWTAQVFPAHFSECYNSVDWFSLLRRFDYLTLCESEWVNSALFWFCLWCFGVFFEMCFSSPGLESSFYFERVILDPLLG